MFVIAQDFDVQPYLLPNLDKKPNSFSDFVTAREEEALRQLLGHLLYDEFIEGLAALPAEWSAATDYAVDALVVLGDDIWKSLQNPNLNQPVAEGAYWTLEEEANKWLLLKNGGQYYTVTNSQITKRWDGMKKLLKPLIYSDWLAFGYTESTGNGEVKSKVENGTVVSPKRKVVSAFNDYSKMAGNGKSKSNTLYGFLIANSDLYPDFVFGDPGRMNIFNL